MTRCAFFLMVVSCLAQAGATVSPQAPPPPACAANGVFTPFSLVPPAKLPVGATPISGRLIRLDFCSDETAGTLSFERLVIREMKVKNLAEYASYTVAVPGAGDVARGLSEAAF